MAVGPTVQTGSAASVDVAMPLTRRSCLLRVQTRASVTLKALISLTRLPAGYFSRAFLELCTEASFLNLAGEHRLKRLVHAPPMFPILKCKRKYYPEGISRGLSFLHCRIQAGQEEEGKKGEHFFSCHSNLVLTPPSFFEVPR